MFACYWIGDEREERAEVWGWEEGGFGFGSWIGLLGVFGFCRVEWEVCHARGTGVKEVLVDGVVHLLVRRWTSLGRKTIGITGRLFATHPLSSRLRVPAPAAPVRHRHHARHALLSVSSDSVVYRSMNSTSSIAGRKPLDRQDGRRLISALSPTASASKVRVGRAVLSHAQRYTGNYPKSD